MAQALPSNPPPERPPGRVLNFPSRRPPRWRWALPAALVLVLATVGTLYATGQLTTLQRRLFRQSNAPTFQTATVARGDVAETVTATGPVAAAQTLPLSFKSSGKLADLKVTVGQKVKKGDALAQLDTTDLQAALEQAKASLQQAQANYDKLKLGATPEQVQTAQVALDNAQKAAADAADAAATSQTSAQKDAQAAQAQAAAAQTGVQTAQAALGSAQEQAKTGAAQDEQSLAQAQTALDAANTQRDAGLAQDQTTVANAQKALDAAKGVVGTGPALLQQQLAKLKDDLWSAQISRDATCGRDHGPTCQAANATVAGLQSQVDNFNATSAQSQQQNAQTVQQAQNALDAAKAAAEADKAKLDASVASAQKALEAARAAQASNAAKLQASIVTAQNQVKQAQAQLQTAQVGIEQAQAKAAASGQTAQQSADQAQGQVKTAEASLKQTAAPPIQADLDAAAAQVANAQVAVKTAQNNLDAATLVAPIDGTVTAISGTVGQWITGGAVTTSATSATGGVITLATLDDLQVTANVNEADIGKVKIGDPVSFSVSAFPGKVFAGQVMQIQPTGVTTSNVVNFAVTSSIKSSEGAALYPGMTAQVNVTTAQAKGVPLVPNSALAFAKTAGQNGAVMLLQNGRAVPVKVTTGVSDGTNTEVTAGLQEGQTIVTGRSGGTATGASGAGTGFRNGNTNGQRAGAANPLTGGGPGPVVRGG